MSTIHPSAFIDPKARIGEGVTIGPYCIVGPDVQIGNGTLLKSHVVVTGPTTIGEENCFFPFCSIGEQSQDLKYEKEPTFLEIGHRNRFRESCTVNRGTAPESFTRIGSDNHFLAYSHVAHDCVVGNHVIFSNNGTLAGHVVVDDHAIIGGLTAIHQFCRIGRHSILGGCSKIVQDVPPFMIADGNPAVVRGINTVGLERRGFSKEAIRSLKEAYRIIYRTQLNTKQALCALREMESLPDIELLITFITESQRGIIR